MAWLTYISRSFNSTRYIRNTSREFSRWASLTFQLHTVHQEQPILLTQRIITPELSTPHGTLGTEEHEEELKQKPFFQLHTVHQEPCVQLWKQRSITKLSTPHGTLGTYISQKQICSPDYFQLHTVHQERGVLFEKERPILPFNSTRYIRNPKRPH